MIDKSLLSLLEHLYEAVYIVDKDRKILFWNDNSKAITGYDKQFMLGKYCYNNILQHIDEDGNQLCHNGCPLHATLQDGKIRENKVFLHHKDGHRVPINVKIFPLYDEKGQIDSCVEVFNHSNYYLENREKIEKLQKEAYIDPLTGISNRRYLEEFLHMKIDDYKKYQVPFEIPFGVIFFDIDHFKQFNDNYGHDIGDEILKLVSKTISSATRHVDLVSRFGGEEFVIILFGIDQDTLKKVANKYRILISESFIRSNNERLFCTVSMGATLVNKKDTYESVIKRADSLMYQAKKNGRNQVIVG